MQDNSRENIQGNELSTDFTENSRGNASSADFTENSQNDPLYADSTENIQDNELPADSRENIQGNASSTNTTGNIQGNASSINSPAESIPNESSIVIYNNDPINTINNSSEVISGDTSRLNEEISNAYEIMDRATVLTRLVERELTILQEARRNVIQNFSGGVNTDIDIILIPLRERFRIYVTNMIRPDAMEDSDETVDSLTELMYNTYENVYDELEIAVDTDMRDILLEPTIYNLIANGYTLIGQGEAATLQLEISKLATLEAFVAFLEMVRCVFP